MLSLLLFFFSSLVATLIGAKDKIPSQEEESPSSLSQETLSEKMNRASQWDPAGMGAPWARWHGKDAEPEHPGGAESRLG